MIAYNWKAEFSQSEIDIIGFHREWHKDNCEAIRREISTILISEMAAVLDRYEAILNEMQETKESTSTGWDESI